MDEGDPANKLILLGRSLAHELVDSRDSSVFQTVLKLFQRAGLEPVMEVEVITPYEYLGDVIALINSRCGQIQGIESPSIEQAVSARVLLMNMFGFANELFLSTNGSARYTAHFSHFDQVRDDGGPPDTEPAASALRA